MSRYDSWLESGIQDAYDDQEEWAERVADAVEFDMRKGGRFDPTAQENWAEAISQMGLAEELQDIDPTTASLELKEKVWDYWYDAAVHVNERDLG